MENNMSVFENVTLMTTSDTGFFWNIFLKHF